MLTKFETKTARVKGLSFHPKRPWILASLHNGSVQIWDYRMGTVIDTYNEHDGPVRSCAFHPTQPLFATCGDDNKVRVFNFQQKKCLFVLTGHQDYIRTVTFHHESPWLMTASDDQTIRIWNWQSRSCVAQLTGHSHYVMCAQFHPKDDLVVSASLDQTIRVWDIGYLKRKGSMTPTDDVGSGSNRGVGQIDLFASSDGQVKFVLEGHDRGVNWVQFHPSKPLIVSGSDDRSVKLWRYNDARAWETDTFRGHFNNVSCVVFHPTLDLILSASEDKTIRVWDYSKKQNSPAQIFRRDSDRYWMLAVHPTLGTFAAGHDCGMQVFKLERERPPQILIDDSCLFYLKGGQMIRRDLNKAVGGETNLVTLKVVPSLPALVDYSPADKAFLISYGNEFQLVSRDVKSGLGSHALFLGQGRFLVFDKQDQLLLIKSISDASNIGAITSPLVDLERVFPTPSPNCVLLTSPSGVSLFDLESQVVLAEAAIPKVKRVSWSPDGSRCALMSKKGVFLLDRMLGQIACFTEAVSIKSGVWDREAALFYYTTPHHLKYMLPTGETGIICTIENPLYLVRVRGELVQALDRQCQLVALIVDPAEYVFKLALIERDMPRVMSIIQNSNLVGQSVISYLRSHGYASIALQFVEEPMSRFELALECAEWEAAIEAAELIGRDETWLSLAKHARNLGFPAIAKLAYGKANAHSEVLFLSALTGKLPGSPVPTDADLSTRLQGSMLMGDSLSLAKTLEEMGLHSLAYLAYRSAGNTSLTPKTNADLLELMAAPLKPCKPSGPPNDDPWTLSKPLGEPDIPAPPPLANKAQQYNQHQQPHAISPLDNADGAAGGWDQGEEIRVSGIPEDHHDFTDFAAPQLNPLLQSKVPALHLLAGNLESCKRLLTQQAGIVDFDPLRSIFDEAAQRQAFGAFVNRFEDVQPFITLSDCQASLEEGLQLTTEGRFFDAVGSFERVLHSAPLILLSEDEAESDVKAMISEAKEYLTGLHMELRRKELLAAATASGGELEGEKAARVLELACYFTCCKLRPAHLILALRSAMTLAFKLKQVALSGSMARRLLDLSPAEPIAAQAQKVLSVASKTPTTTGTMALDIQFDDHLDFDLDAGKYSPIYVGQPSAACPHCGAFYGPKEASTVCRVCRIASIGAPATGLQLKL